jgi:hypothetical protein
MEDVNTKTGEIVFPIRENFCPACIAALPLAFGGLGSGIKAATMSEEEKKKNKRKNVMLIVFSVVLTLLAIYFWRRSKSGKCGIFGSNSKQMCGGK